MPATLNAVSQKRKVQPEISQIFFAILEKLKRIPQAETSTDQSDLRALIAVDETEEVEILLDLQMSDGRYLLLRASCVELQNQVDIDRQNLDGRTIEDLRDEVHLSPREQEIVRLVARGYPNKTIAGILDISPWTVSTHLRRIFNKLSVNSRAEMVASALNTGLIRGSEV